MEHGGGAARWLDHSRREIAQPGNGRADGTQDFIVNQRLLKKVGEKEFMVQWNAGDRNITRFEDYDGDDKRDQ